MFGTRSTKFAISKTIYPTLVFLIIVVPLVVHSGEFKTELIFPLTALFAGWLLGWVVSARLLPNPPTEQNYANMKALKAIQEKGLPLNHQSRFVFHPPRWAVIAQNVILRNGLAFAFAIMMWLLYINIHV